MSIKILPFLCLIITPFLSRSQYVTIPDPIFAGKLAAEIPSCMSGNQMDTVCSKIETMNKVLNISNLGIQSIEGIQYTTYQTVDASYNNLTALPENYYMGEVFYGQHNKITKITTQRAANYADLSYNEIDSVTPFATSSSYLANVNYSHNKIRKLESLNGHIYGDFSYNLIEEIKGSIYSTGNLSHNRLKSIVIQRKQEISDFDLSYNQLESIVIIPTSEPDKKFSLNVSHNKLTYLPTELTGKLNYLDCSFNDICCFDDLLQGLNSGVISDNPNTCLPHYNSWMTASDLSKPLCASYDPITNPCNCKIDNGISGRIFQDDNLNCAWDTLSERPLEYSAICLYDSNNRMVSYTRVDRAGFYHFDTVAPMGSVRIIDYSGTHDFCQGPNGILLNTNNSDTTILVDNYFIDCSTDSTLFYSEHFLNRRPFPGTSYYFIVKITDLLTDSYCQSVVKPDSVKLEVNFNGTGKLVNATSNGTNLLLSDFYSITRFLDYDSSYLLLEIMTDTSAQNGEIHTFNSILTSYFGGQTQVRTNASAITVGNSYDPNDKKCDQTSVEPGYGGFLDYTIRFQNTGTVAARNIVLHDTLESTLDPESFQFLSSSHYNIANLQDGVLRFTFPNIMLADSASDPVRSIGFVRFRIKPYEAMNLGEIIHNTANIYFDYNAPITTNTAETVCEMQNSSLEEIKRKPISVYPNPGKGQFKFKGLEQNAFFTISDLNGKILLNGHINSDQTLDLSSFQNGLYFINLQSKSFTETIRIIKQ